MKTLITFQDNQLEDIDIVREDMFLTRSEFIRQGCGLMIQKWRREQAHLEAIREGKIVPNALPTMVNK